jgi:predicted trehalose synthase
MSDLVTEDDLTRARTDPAFRQQLMADSLERLLEALNEMRKASEIPPDAARQIREGVDLAVQLADRLQQNAHNSGPQAA